MRPLIALAISTFGIAAIPAYAHTVWLEAEGNGGELRVRFGGHEGRTESYPAGKLKEVVGYTATGRTVPVGRRVDGSGAVILHPGGRVAFVTVHFDNGIYSTTPEGRSVNLPMDQVPGATKAVDAVKYNKTVLLWTPRITRPIGQRMEVVPLDAAPPRAGAPMRVRVLLDGKPQAGIRLGRGEDKPGGGGTTDARGVASFVPERGSNKLWAGKRIATAGNPHLTELSYEYILGFTAS